MAINNNPSRDRMSPMSTIWGRAKRSHTVDLFPSAPSAIFITMACVLRNATNVTRTFQERLSKVEVRMGEMGVHKAGCMQLGMQRRKGMH
ncbi:hypothetical protein Tco_1392926 [Tanacetum coccineum]